MKINSLLAADGVLGFNIFDEFSWYSTHHGVREYILGDYCARGDHGTLANADAICDDGAGSQPNIVFDDDALSGDALLDERPIGVAEDVINGDDLGEGGGVDAITNVDAALAADDRVFTDQTLAANGDAGVREVAEVVDMEDGAVHHDGVGSDFNPAGTGVQVSALIQVSTVPEADVIGEAQTDAIFDGRPAVHAQDEAVKEATQANADDGRNPAEEEIYGLFKDIAAETGGLAGEVEV